MIIDTILLTHQKAGNMAISIDLAEAKNNFSRVTAEVNRAGQSVTVLKSNRP